jgi:MoxR-like ATPase
VSQSVQDFAVRLVLATHPGGQFAPPITNQYLRLGASPRGAQAILLAAKVRALIEGRFNVSYDDMRRVALPALRHRILPNFEAQAENVSADAILQQVIAAVPERLEMAA